MNKRIRKKIFNASEYSICGRVKEDGNTLIYTIQNYRYGKPKYIKIYEEVSMRAHLKVINAPFRIRTKLLNEMVPKEKIHRFASESEALDFLESIGWFV